MVSLDRADGWWSTDDTPRGERTDAWRSAIRTNYRDWELPDGLPTGFTARLRQRDLAGLRLVECRCGPCGGRRLTRQLARDPEPFLAIQVIRDGAERLRMGEETLLASTGDLLIWSTLPATEFEIPERLSKATIMIPLAALGERLPPGRAFTACVLDARSGIGAVLSNHVEALVAEIDRLHETEAQAARRATLELLAAAVARQAGAIAPQLGQQHLRRVQDYILQHLRDRELSLGGIARANGISVRYLHLLFARAGLSAFSWIREQRLQRCRDALVDPTLNARLVAEIAFDWGFGDAAHFSRSFKRRFGHSPSAFRASAGHGTDLPQPEG
jgi:AraC-like DNA-binding protein